MAKCGYGVRVITPDSDPNWGKELYYGQRPGRLLKLARKVANEYQYGVALVDYDRDRVDYGGGWETPVIEKSIPT